MDSNIIVAIISASSAVSVSIVALIVNAVWMGRAFDLLAKRIEKLETSMDMLTGAMHELDKRLSVIEDRVGGSR